MTKEEFEEIIKPLYLMNGKDCQFMRSALLGNFDKIEEIENISLLQRAVETLDDYLNAGSKDTRANASDKAKKIYQEYYNKEYRNRNER